MAIMVGSARHDEDGKYVNGNIGDSLQKSSTNDLAGEVSMQKMYIHSKGWYILRPKSVDHANAIADKMKVACNNANIGYDQNNRLGVITYGVNTEVKTECDCSSLVRECVKEATGKDVGNFTTANEVSVLEKSGLFEKKVAYVSQAKTPVYDGDVLVTKTKGHTVVVVSGNPRYAISTVLPITEFKVGDTVMFTGSLHYTNSYSSGIARGCRAGLAKITRITAGKAHPYHLKAVAGKGSTVNGWVNEKDVSKVTATSNKTHVVKKGESLSSIAKKYDTTVNKLVSLNGIKNPNLVRVGQIVKLP